ncbi:MAG: alpha-amylase, partial [Alphaproteobacteria bacterium]|nr:alpha-amylase [Alphaproteobacteria bacterium]
GTNADFKRLVDAAHARGMKVYMDIVVNHTADVIQYKECLPGKPCPYRSIADYPYTRQGGVNGAPINPGFEGDDAAHQTPANFAHLTNPDYAYTPFVPKGERHVKKPEWLNNPIYYHNRGDTTYRGENSTYGDFGGLDDIFTENPRVVQGFIDIYGKWIDDYHIDGFRIDTAKHVNPEFWARFVPAMMARAKAAGITHFHIFGEVPDPEFSPAFAKTHHLPALLDFGVFGAIRSVVAEGQSPALLNRAFWNDALWPNGAEGARQLATFVGNHDAGRFAMFVRRANPKASKDELEKRTLLGYAMLLSLRGVPVIYYGDEQGFIGHGDDKDARQDMFGSKVASYNDDMLLGTSATTATPRFDTSHPFYKAIAEMNRIRRVTPALRHGDQIFRTSEDDPGLIAVSRKLPGKEGEVLLVFNTSAHTIKRQVLVDSASAHWHSLHGHCANAPSAPGSYPITLAPFDYLFCTTGN